MIPFYIFYSMFGFQRTGDQIWAAGDAMARGFVLGAHRRPHHAERRGPAARGRPQPPARDGRARTCSRLRPRVRLRDSRVIVQDGMRRMVQRDENVFYYITLQNENYPMPPMPGRA